MDVEEAMGPRRTRPAGIPPTASLREAARWMDETGASALPVVVEDEVVGVVTDRDLALHAVARGLSADSPVETVMAGESVTVGPDTDVPVAIRSMRSAGARHLPVADGGGVVGMVSFDDLLWALTQELVDLTTPIDAARRRRDQPPAR
ncbi:CBS domain-containing protein [Streptomyces sp. NBC_01803]|uniref:CBS domain-containing protein n=1 Tax=Streptomyces sp. NBC_01803 TaxID=2975946 RepID=UPI002DDB1BE2|nr:CBS domain-containing protein [Streptomyces sp. NBC_01803]WSA47358.1 CBS domain-containing protein [Streptomyces sp. NBC_01803]